MVQKTVHFWGVAGGRLPQICYKGEYVSMMELLYAYINSDNVRTANVYILSTTTIQYRDPVERHSLLLQITGVLG